MVFQPSAIIGNLLPWAQSASAVLPTAGKLLGVIAAGGFGGAIYAIASLFEEGKEEEKQEGEEGLRKSDGWKATKGCSVPQYIAGQAAIGAGGAFAALFGILTLGNTVHATTAGDLTENPIYFVALCVVGGYIGNTLLVGIGKKLEEQITHIEHRQKTLEKNQNTLAEKSEAGINTAVDKASTAVDKASVAESRAKKLESLLNQVKDMPGDVWIARDLADKLDNPKKPKEQIPEALRTEAEAARAKLNGYREAFPTTRSLFIVLANLTFALDHADDALATLNEFITNRKSVPSKSDDDVSAWYNVGCFYAVLSASDAKSRGYTKDESVESLQKKSLEALRECLEVARLCGPEKLSQRLAKMNAPDPDLAAIQPLEAYKELMAQYEGGNGS